MGAFFNLQTILYLYQVCFSDRQRPRKKQKVNKKGKGREWVLRKKEQMRNKGINVPPNTKYTARKRKARFWSICCNLNFGCGCSCLCTDACWSCCHFLVNSWLEMTKMRWITINRAWSQVGRDDYSSQNLEGTLFSLVLFWFKLLWEVERYAICFPKLFCLHVKVIPVPWMASKFQWISWDFSQHFLKKILFIFLAVCRTGKHYLICLGLAFMPSQFYNSFLI